MSGKDYVDRFIKKDVAIEKYCEEMLEMQAIKPERKLEKII